MNLWTPRRRISPRTIRRYRAIKNFLQRALGSSSQPNINTNSSYVSISELKHKIVGIEKQLNSVSKHCQDLACLESNLKPTSSISTVTTRVQDNVDSDKDTYIKALKVPETKVLYKTSLDRLQKPVSRPISRETFYNDDTKIKTRSEIKMINENNAFYKQKRRNKHDRLDSIQEGGQTLHKHHSALENYDTAGPTTSYNSFQDRKIEHPDAGYLEIRHHKKRNKKAYEMNPHLVEQRWRTHKNKNLRSKDIHSELGQDFITEIIRRQYRPVKLFGRRESDFSQFSAPVCRDQEFPIRETVQKGSKLCSCSHEEHRRQKHSKYMCTNDLSDIRSICDTRLYSCRKQKHQMNRKKRFEDYNDSAIYDIVPVKENSSPKSRRKFVEDNVFASDKYREVPPSPRTHRPRLNLQAQVYTEEDNDYFHLEKLPRNISQPKSPIQNYCNHSNISSKLFIQNRSGNGIQQSHVANTTKLYNQGGLESISSIQHPRIVKELANNDATLSSQTTGTSSVEKTDKTLTEIKNILESFLMEMKKESSQNDNLNVPSDTQKNVETQQLDNRNTASNFGCSYNNGNSSGQCMPPFMQYFTNPCFYPILPICPMNCMQNGFVVSSPSCTCAGCANNSRDRTCGINDSKNKTHCPEGTETQKLIKEIHKLISQNPNAVQKKHFCNVNSSTASKNYAEPKIVMSRSVGGSSKASKHDAKVGTKMKCYSKSCEAMNTNTGCAANVSYSDTVLEKGSSEEATNALSTSEYSSDTTIANKKKENRFLKMLKSIGLLKKNKTNAIEKLCESDSSIENQRPQARPPFQQHLMNYNMHGQEYYNPPPMPPYQPHQHQYQYCSHSPSPGTCYSPRCEHDRMKNFQKGYNPECCIRSHCTSPQHTPMPDYLNYYDRYGNVSPQVPLCLKEIEVKSIGTQSARKMSLLQKFTNKMQAPAPKIKESAQSQFSKVASKDKAVKNNSDWKKWQTKADPLKFSYKTQKRLAEGDIKMRNAMLKKLFYKRNPFSPRNLLVRTLLGKDKSSFGEPPKIYKPKMFL